MKGKESWVFAVLLSLFFLATSLHVASRRLLWFDEINTLQIAQLPDLKTLWEVQNGFRGDSPPIVYHLLVRLIYHLTGKAEIAVRLLSAVAMALALLVVFDCTRRLTDGTHGLVAMCVLTTSFLTYYGYEGRPYALVVLFTSIALWLWLHTKPDSNAAAVAFGVTMFLALTMQFNAVLALAPFGLWELYHWRPWKMPSPKLMAGVIATVCAIALCLPQMRQASAWFVISWCPPSIPALAAVYGEMFPLGLLVLAIFAILVCLLRTGGKPMGDAESLCWLFLTVPIAGFVVAEAVTNAFYNRYLIAMLPGVAVAFACLVSRYLTRPASIAFLLFLIGLGCARQIAHAHNAAILEPPSAVNEQHYTREALAAEDALIADGKKIVITEFLVVKEMQYYSKHPEMYAMYAPDTSAPFCKYFGSSCWNAASVKAHAQEVAGFYPSTGLLSDMTRAGFQANVIKTDPMIVYFSPPPNK
jgi:uncharacterized membrane protein